MSEPQARSEIAIGILLAPFRLFGLLALMLYMVATVPLLLLAIIALLVPAEVLWCVSPFVGLVSPAAGHKLASLMDPACDKLDAVIDTLWAPLDLIDDVLA